MRDAGSRFVGVFHQYLYLKKQTNKQTNKQTKQNKTKNQKTNKQTKNTWKHNYIPILIILIHFFSPHELWYFYWSYVFFLICKWWLMPMLMQNSKAWWFQQSLLSQTYTWHPLSVYNTIFFSLTHGYVCMLYGHRNLGNTTDIDRHKYIPEPAPSLFRLGAPIGVSK